MTKDKKKLIFLFLTFLLLIAFLITWIKTYNQNWKTAYIRPTPTLYNATPIPTVENTESPVMESVPPSENPLHNKLFITVERQNYKAGDLTLIIPKLNLKEAVEDGTASEDLRKGPGLYDYSQLPSEGDCNVSIAAHRNTRRNGVIGKWFFYYIDTLTTGDYLYLADSKNIYRYKYDSTKVVEPTDWSPIYCQGFSCLTLTSCEPIGISTHRIVVQSKLDKIFPFSKKYKYKRNSEVPSS